VVNLIVKEGIMARGINPKWINDVKTGVENYQNNNEDGMQFERVLNHNAAAQWLIKYMTGKGVAFKVLNLGAGVKRITTDTDVCPKCKGTGRC